MSSPTYREAQEARNTYRPTMFQVLDAGIDRNGNGRRVVTVRNRSGDLIHVERIQSNNPRPELRAWLATTVYQTKLENMADLGTVRVPPSELRSFEREPIRFPEQLLKSAR